MSVIIAPLVATLPFSLSGAPLAFSPHPSYTISPFLPFQVLWLEQQVAKRRSKRDVYQEPTDPKFPQQWYLVCGL